MTQTLQSVCALCARVSVNMPACVCVRVCARLGDIKPTLRWRTVLEIRARSHGAPTTSTASIETGVKALSHSASPLPPVLTPLPLSLFKSLMHKYKQVLDEDCRGSSKCTCYAKTAGPLMRANYFRKQ